MIALVVKTFDNSISKQKSTRDLVKLIGISDNNYFHFSFEMQ